MIKIIYKKKKNIAPQVMIILLKLIKYLSIPIIALIGAVVAVLLLSGETIRIEHFRPATVFFIMQNAQNALLFFFVGLGIIGIIFMFFAFSMSKKSEDFRAELIEVTDKIKTPAAVGQSQHGSARWMKSVQAKRAFATFIINKKKNDMVKDMITKGIAAKADLIPRRNRNTLGGESSADDSIKSTNN